LSADRAVSMRELDVRGAAYKLFPGARPGRKAAIMPRRTSPTPPPGEILDLIKREIASHGFLRELTVWADRQCARQLSIEGRVDPQKASDLVNAAIVDTCNGVRIWDPSARPLRRHLEQTINSRLWHECEQMRRRRFLPLTAATVEDSQDAAAALEVEMCEQREDPRTRPDAQLAQREVRARVYAALRERAERDPQVLALLTAYERGHSKQADAETHVGINGQAFQNLMRRFRTIRGHLPGELRSAALDVILRDGGAPIATVARRRGRLVEILADQTASNDSCDSLAPLSLSGDGDGGGDSTDGSQAAA
jgi:hypothetical protein